MKKLKFYLGALLLCSAAMGVRPLEAKQPVRVEQKVSKKREYSFKKRWREIASITVFGFFAGGFLYAVLGKGEVFGLSFERTHAFIVAAVSGLLAFFLAYIGSRVFIKKTRTTVVTVKKEKKESPLDSSLVEAVGKDASLLTKDMVERLHNSGIYKLKDLAGMSTSELKKLGFSRSSAKKFKNYIKEKAYDFKRLQKKVSGGSESRIKQMLKDTDPQDIGILLDLILLFLLLLSAFYGFRKGFFSQFIPLGVIAFFLKDIQFFYEKLQDILDDLFPHASDATIYFFTGIILLVSCFVVMFILERIFGRILRLTFLGYFDGLFGAFIGMGQTVLFLALLIFLLRLNGVELPEVYAEQTIIYKMIKSFVPKFLGIAKKVFPKYIDLSE